MRVAAVQTVIIPRNFSMVGRLSVVLLFSAILTTLNGQSCLRTNHSSRSLPVLQDYSKTEFTFGAIRHRSQAIIPSYRFQGRGSIMEWGIDLNPANNGNQDMYVLNLQVWRPSPTVATDGCYSLVGSNRFRSVVISGGIARVTPLPIDRIRFQSGDVLGFYVESTRGFNAQSRGVVTLNDFHRHGDRGFETEQVWYANVGDIASTNSECPCPVGLHRGLNTFTNAAPVISVSTDSCLHPSSKTVMNAPINPSSSPIYNTRTTGIFLPTPQVQSSLTYVNSYPNTIGIIVGVILVVVVVVTLTTVIVVLAIRTIRKKNKKYLNRGASMIGNAAYNGTTFENLNARYSTHTGGTYEYAKHGVQNGHKNTEVHAAAAMTINELEASCRPSTVYIMSMAAQRNEAYGTAQTNDYEDMEYSYIRYY